MRLHISNLTHAEWWFNTTNHKLTVFQFFLSKAFAPLCGPTSYAQNVIHVFFFFEAFSMFNIQVFHLRTLGFQPPRFAFSFVTILNSLAKSTFIIEFPTLDFYILEIRHPPFILSIYSNQFTTFQSTLPLNFFLGSLCPSPLKFSLCLTRSLIKFSKRCNSNVASLCHCYFFVSKVFSQDITVLAVNLSSHYLFTS